MYHILREPSHLVLSNLSRNHRDVRVWFNTFGQLVGVWTMPNGRQAAIGHNPQGQTLAYVTDRKS
mgnify:CR=1 FL=1